MFFNKIKTMPINKEDELALSEFEFHFQEFDGECSLKEGDGSSVDISIVCVTYNHRQFIERTLFGFLRQKFDLTVEILIFDDCSTDGTSEILQSYASEYPNLISLHIQPYNKFSKGEAEPHLFFERARGRYIAYCEGDDFWLSELKLATQFSYLEKNPHVTLTYGRAMFIDGYGALIPTFSSRTNYLDHEGKNLETGVNIFTLTAMFRNQFTVIDVKGKNVYLDIILWSQCGEFGAGHFMKELAACAYRVHTRGLNSGASTFKRHQMLSDTYLLLLHYKLKRFRTSALRLTLKFIVSKVRLLIVERKKNA